MDNIITEWDLPPSLHLVFATPGARVLFNLVDDKPTMMAKALSRWSRVTASDREDSGDGCGRKSDSR